MKKIKVGSRGSELAVKQSRIIMGKIKEFFPEYETELVTIETTGDKRQDISLEKIGGRGVFVKELDKALLQGEVDITVHSLKDMPTEQNEELPIIAYSKREVPFDVLVLPKDGVIDLSRVGCSSSRRAMQLKELYPNANIVPIRGNVPTRINKLDSGEYTAIVLAAAGLERLGLTGRISRVFDQSEIVPAPGQGIIAVQCRKGFEFLNKISDKNAEICARAELACVRTLGGGCSAPLGVFAPADGEDLFIYGYYHNGSVGVRKQLTGKVSDPESLGKKLAEELRT